MEFIEISDGVSVRRDQIIAITRMDDQFKTKLLVGTQILEANFPYLTLLSILEASEKPEQESNREVLKEISQKVGNLPVFAG